MTLDPNLIALAATRNIGALATIKRDSRPQLSAVNFILDPAAGVARVSVVDGRAKVHNLRRDPRASIFVASPDGWTYAVLEGTVDLSPVAMAPDDDTVEELVEVFRAIRGEDHPDWDEYRAAMVADGRLVARLRVEHAYGLTRQDQQPSSPRGPSRCSRPQPVTAVVSRPGVRPVSGEPLPGTGWSPRCHRETRWWARSDSHR